MQLSNIKYGLTPNGPNPKRLDVILEEMHAKLTEKTGVNTRQNPESLLNHLLTNIADAIAELWEYGTDVYNSQYPMSAEGSNLDNAMQFGGITRDMPEKSYYPILCTGVDGTTIPAGTLIATDTNPSTELTNSAEAQITRASFNKVVIVVASNKTFNAMSAVINGKMYSADTLENLAGAITDDNFNTVYEEGKLFLSANDETSNNSLILSENLTTETVSSVVTFGTSEYGDIVIPNGVITKIVKSVAGLQEITNVGSYIAGRLRETDAEFRKSYVEKIFNRSSSMLESVKSAILENVQGVRSVAVYENDTNEFDDMGRPPHSIEVVVDGGDKTEIAQQIFNSKCGGISTCCTEENGEIVVLKGIYGEDVTIRFNRPTDIYIWFQIGVTFNGVTNPPSNYADRIKEIVLECMQEIGAGENVLPQRFAERLGNEIPGIDYYDIRLFVTTDRQETPAEFTERSAKIKPRERAITSESRIGVKIDG